MRRLGPTRDDWAPRGTAAGPRGATAALTAVAPRAGQRTRPYQTLFVQIFSRFTTSPLFGECQILPFPA